MSKSEEELRAELAEIKSKTAAARNEQVKLAREAESVMRAERLETDIRISQRRLDKEEKQLERQKAQMADAPAPTPEPKAAKEPKPEPKKTEKKNDPKGETE